MRNIYSGALTSYSVAKDYLSVADVDMPFSKKCFFTYMGGNVHFLIAGNDHSHVIPRTIAMPKVKYHSVFILRYIQGLHLFASVIFHS